MVTTFFFYNENTHTWWDGLRDIWSNWLSGLKLPDLYECFDGLIVLSFIDAIEWWLPWLLFSDDWALEKNAKQLNLIWCLIWYLNHWFKITYIQIYKHTHIYIHIHTNIHSTCGWGHITILRVPVQYWMSPGRSMCSSQSWYSRSRFMV